MSNLKCLSCRNGWQVTADTIQKRLEPQTNWIGNVAVGHNVTTLHDIGSIHSLSSWIYAVASKTSDKSFCTRAANAMLTFLCGRSCADTKRPTLALASATYLRMAFIDCHPSLMVPACFMLAYRFGQLARLTTKIPRG